LRDGKVHPLWTHHIPSIRLGGIYSTGGAPSIVYVVASSGGRIVLLSKTGERLWEHETGAQNVITTISEDGSYIAAGDSEGNIQIFRLKSSTPFWSYSTGSVIISIAISFDSKFVVAGGLNGEGRGEIYLFSLNDGQLIHNSQFERPIRTVHISYNGEYVIADKEDGTAIIIHYEENSISEDALNVPNGIRSIHFSLFGSFVTASNNDGEVYLYYLPRPAPLWKFGNQDGEPLMDLTRKGDCVFVASSESVHLLSNTAMTEMIPGSRVGWAAVFFLGAISSIVLTRGRQIFNQTTRGEYLTLLLGFVIGATLGFILTRDLGKAVLVCGVGFASGSLIGWRGRSLTSFVSGCYLGCFGSGAAGYLLSLLIWFAGDEGNIVNLTLSYLFDGIKLGVLFGPLGAIIGVYAMNSIISKIIDSSS
jgi:WD40 repeat protein